MALIVRRGRPYLYRSVRRGGRVTSEYVTSGVDAELIGGLQAVERQIELDRREAWKAERGRLDEEERSHAELFDRIQALADAALVLAGCHRHKNQWRRRRA